MMARTRTSVVCVALAAAVMMVGVAALPAKARECSKHADCADGQHCLFTFDGDERAHGLCFDRMQSPEAQAALNRVASSELQLGEVPKVKGLPGLNVTSLTVNAPEGQAARVVIGSGDSQYSVGVHADGTFAITQGRDKDVLAVNKDGDIVARTKMLAAGALAADNGFIVDTVPQWSMWRSEEFGKTAEGWSAEVVSHCAGIHMLGGTAATAKAKITKKFKGLPRHNRVRVTGTFHFVDLWQGETGFMQLSSGESGAMEYAWVDRYDLKDTEKLPNVCGSDRYGEGKFSVPFDVTIFHTGDNLDVAFGSTLSTDDGSALWGVSALAVHVRNTECPGC